MNDFTTLAMAHRCNAHIPNKAKRSSKIANCARVIADRTDDDSLRSSCLELVEQHSNCEYDKVIESVRLASAIYIEHVIAT